MKSIVRSVRRWFTAPTEELGRWARFLVFQVRIWRHCIRLLRVNRCGTQAAALSYYTIFGLVPAAIAMLMIFQMFPTYRDLAGKVRSFVYGQLNLTSLEYPAAQVAVPPGASAEEPAKISVSQKLDEVIDHYLERLNTGAIGIVSGLLVVYAAIGLLSTIEKAFNLIYRVPMGRSFLKRMVNYWSLLTLGPLLLGVGIHFSTKFLMMEGFHQGILPYVRPILPFLISILLFFLLYYMLPNTAVSPSAALWGAIVAAVLWTIAKSLFGLYVTKFVPFNAVWGILGIIPLTVFWIYWTWIFILFGLQLTYAVQNLRTLDAAELARVQRGSDVCFLANGQTVTAMMEFVLRVFEQKEELPVSVEQVAAHLQMPAGFAQRLLDQLVKAGLLYRTNEPVQGYVPSTDGANISLADISQAVSSLSYGRSALKCSPKITAVFEKIRQMLAQYTLKDVLEPFSKETAKPQESPPPQDQTSV
ncbi:MAG TPA: YhjD/YihY/BrkB family envelope integrity protein [Anaerohalosphaeraceae bacterium]|nr:YhjD/YihY/BrkB family envelope integrity protein [Anaerohalosphaeraceae bacterium]HQG05600.1 YhjD/YihY/BrkB family envelope integrity protein [Anaerohalosphaeraceae bacterium]HQI07344.1 YhjD/YihY/BrkB family envelope integrity protein [Anaerohalosphaeraceae bacterium]HQJ67548.1 YhjD/YihY/BrkB family envelope integrity protein [Anaerohalosphaeraceae bacterium]